tara:strand:- start:33 stop:389 length:357 start_codon:yes stop_codon:yes gene_type:complete
MAVTWTIEQLVRNTTDDGVITADWKALEVSGEHTGHAYGTCMFEPDADSESFIPFVDLTEEDVIRWVKSDINADDIEAYITLQIEESKQEPVTLAGVPWITLQIEESEQEPFTSAGVP